jgi:hypothetical protein
LKSNPGNGNNTKVQKATAKNKDVAVYTSKRNYYSAYSK